MDCALLFFRAVIVDIFHVDFLCNHEANLIWDIAKEGSRCIACHFLVVFLSVLPFCIGSLVLLALFTTEGTIVKASQGSSRSMHESIETTIVVICAKH